VHFHAERRFSWTAAPASAEGEPSALAVIRTTRRSRHRDCPAIYLFARLRRELQRDAKAEVRAPRCSSISTPGTCGTPASRQARLARRALSTARERRQTPAAHRGRSRYMAESSRRDELCDRHLPARRLSLQRRTRSWTDRTPRKRQLSLRPCWGPVPLLPASRLDDHARPRRTCRRGAIYEQHCAACHGAKRKAAGWAPAPAERACRPPRTTRGSHLDHPDECVGITNGACPPYAPADTKRHASFRRQLTMMKSVQCSVDRHATGLRRGPRSAAEMMRNARK